jgi:hypothetical protein
MKNLPYIVLLAPILCLVILAALAALGVSLPYISIASDIVGFSCGAGVISFFLADYAAGRPNHYVDLRSAEPKSEVALVAPTRQKRARRRVELPFEPAMTLNLMREIRLRDEPSNLSLQ